MTKLNDVVTFYLLDTYSLNTCNPKLYYGETPITKSNPGENYLYGLVCEGNVDNSSMCIQTSRNFYDKGKYFHDLQAGIQVVGLDVDDFGNTCQCRSAFNGLYNIYAGYTNSTVIPCAKFDVQSTVYPIK
ncbi:Uncharacterized protein FWK35_00011464 [Aphis craccivora]|uniref:Uncharacterized protein n=1 Tax=Aphis craccivora TaxID=307492 RepID=A0A6G0YHZ4_APHCR|nr:Uncharacterized protein FWK35_00011464 [Aphis craccivora]